MAHCEKNYQNKKIIFWVNLRIKVCYHKNRVSRCENTTCSFFIGAKKSFPQPTRPDSSGINAMRWLPKMLAHL